MPFFGKCGCTGSRAEVEEVNVLNYAHNNLTHVPEEIILHERTLEELCLDANRISELPRWLFQCHGLRILSLTDNEFQSVSPAIASLVNLENLDVSKNGIQEIPDNIKCCKRLSVIEASVNPIGRLPEGFMMLINLRELYLNDTFLEYLPGSFGRLCKLRILEVRENRLKTLPKSLSRLTELERLDLGTNDFDLFPEVICSLVGLLELWMDNNKIEFMPKEIKNLKSLMFLDLTKNQLRSLPKELGECSSLSDLYLSENHIYELPESIGNLSSLTILKLDSNCLTQIPFSIGGLSSLSELILSNNKIEALPTSIGLLRNLRTLNLDENCLIDLPSDIGSCTGITLFSLRANNLEYIPEEIGRINKLRVLNLSSNRLKYLPCSICKLKELQALWLTENQTKPLIPLQQDKDKHGKRFLTCYLFPQDFVANDKQPTMMNQQKSILKSNYNNDSSSNTDIEEQNYYDRQHLIRFTTGDNNTINANESNMNNNSSSDHYLIKPYPKEMKNPMHHLRNLAIYENSINHLFSHPIGENGTEQQQQQSSLHNQFLKSLNFGKNSEDTQLLLNNDENLNKKKFDSNDDEEDDDDLNELMQLANNNREQQHRVSFSKNTINNEVQASPHRSFNQKNGYVNNNQDFTDFFENQKRNHQNDFLNSPRTAKLNHQKLISKIHFERVQEVLNQNAQNHQPLHETSTSAYSSPSLTRRFLNQQQEQHFPDNSNATTNVSFYTPVIFNGESKQLQQHHVHDLQSYDQPTPILTTTAATSSPAIRKSILKTTNTNFDQIKSNLNNAYSSDGDYSAANDEWQRKQQQNDLNIKKQTQFASPKLHVKTAVTGSPLLNTQLAHNKQNFTVNTKSTLVNTITIPSSPLKVNVNDIKWNNLKGVSSQNNSVNTTIVLNEPPSSQVSSDSGYSGQTALQMHTKMNSSSNSSPIAVDTNDNGGPSLPSYEYHHTSAVKFINNLVNVQIVKNPGLGFSISGGKGSIGNPFKPNDPGIFVTKIQSNGPASNLLHPGDQIVKVNGEDFANIEHDKAVTILKSCNKVANLLIKRY